MNVAPDANWLNALKLPAQVMIGLFIASGTLLLFDGTGILELSSLGQFAKPAAVVLAVFSGSLSITGIGAFVLDQLTKHRKQSLLSIRRKLRLQALEDKRAEAEKAALERLDHLSPRELRYLADCLREGSQSFYTYVHDPVVTTLMGKQLVYTPGGNHHRDHYPFTIFDFVWKALLARKDEILTKDEENRKREEEEKRRRRY